MSKNLLTQYMDVPQVPENHTISGGNGDFDDKIDVGLTVRLQHKLKETQLAKDKLEKRLEQLEMRGKLLKIIYTAKLKENLLI